MESFLVGLHVFTCILLVLVVLIQSGRGAEVSASLSGSSQSVFGSSGGANFFTKLTAGAAIVFMLTSIGLTIQAGQKTKSVFEGQESQTTEEAQPAAIQKEEAPKSSE